jgi:hypothetical protein
VPKGAPLSIPGARSFRKLRTGAFKGSVTISSKKS